jgi:hypothetical protein
MPLDLFTNESFRGWFDIFIGVIEMEVPNEIAQLDDDEKQESIYWKCQKWAIKIIDRLFVR